MKKVIFILLFLTFLAEANELKFSNVKPIFENRCVACHLAVVSGNNDWSYFNNVYSKKEEIYLRVVTLKNMPLYTKMPQEERDLIKEWIEQGAQE
jgi:uncharacterized membrane protein